MDWTKLTVSVGSLLVLAAIPGLTFARSALGYGASGAGGVIPPGATLMFDIDLLGVK